MLFVNQRWSLVIKRLFFYFKLTADTGFDLLQYLPIFYRWLHVFFEQIGEPFVHLFLEFDN